MAIPSACVPATSSVVSPHVALKTPGYPAHGSDRRGVYPQPGIRDHPGRGAECPLVVVPVPPGQIRVVRLTEVEDDHVPTVGFAVRSDIQGESGRDLRLRSVERAASRCHSTPSSGEPPLPGASECTHGSGGGKDADPDGASDGAARRGGGAGVTPVAVPAPRLGNASFLKIVHLPCPQRLAVSCPQA